MQLGSQFNPIKKMNSNITATSPLLAAATAFLIMPMSPVASGLIVTVIGVLCLLALDYAGPRTLASIPASITPFGSADRSLAEFRKAA
jgi:hypothetical protein